MKITATDILIFIGLLFCLIGGFFPASGLIHVGGWVTGICICGKGISWFTDHYSF